MIQKGTILFVANTTWSMYNFRKGVMQQLVAEGFMVAVVAPPDGFETRLAEMGVSFYPLLTMRNKGKNPFQDLLLIREFQKLYREIKPAFIFHYTIKPNIYGTIAAARCGIPSIAITTGLGHVFSNSNATAVLVKKLYRYALRHAKEVWFLNKEDQQTFLTLKIIQPAKAFLLNGEGVNTSLYVTSRNGCEAGRKRKFILVARLIYDKGVREFVEATTLLQRKGYHFQSQVLGFLDVQNPEAISRQQVEEWVSNGLIEYLGSTSNVIPYVDAADCMVLPSYYGEGVPRTLMEAASLSKPIITTDHVGCRDVVDNEVSGFLCKIRDVEDLATKMENVLTLSDQQLQEMGANGRAKMMRQFDEKFVIDKYLTILQKYL